MSNQAYIFDMDGVLVNNCRYHVLAWRVFSKKHGFELTDEQVLEWMGAANRVYMQRLLGRPVSDDELAALENEKESLYRELYAPHRRIPDGLRAFLDRAHAADIPCGVATGAPEQNITFILDGLDLRRDFRCVVDPTQYSHSKPAPDCYLRAAALLGVAPANSRTPWPASRPRTPPACAWSPSRPPIPARPCSPPAPIASSIPSRSYVV